MSEIPEPIISSEAITDISPSKQVNNNITTNNPPTKNKINLITRITNNNIQKRIDSPVILKSKRDDSEKTKVEKNKKIKKCKIKNVLNNNNLQENVNINKIIGQYKAQVQRLQYTIKSKDEEINELKIKLENNNNNQNKNINIKYFDTLDTGGMGLKILASKINNNNNNNNNNNETINNKIRTYKIQSLDKMEIYNDNINYNINIETRDSIEILPTVKAPLKGQKTLQMQINPLKKMNYIQILDQLAILNNNQIIRNNNNIEIEERDSIEILPTQKTPLKAQKINQMYIERLKIPEFFIQNIDNMSIIEDTKKNKNNNEIESRDCIQIFSLEVTPLQMQHVQKMYIEKFQKNKKNDENQDILSTPRNKNYTKLINSIEHIPIKKSPLQLKNAEELRTKYLKKFKSENKDSNNSINKRKEESRIVHTSINVCHINSKPKSNNKNNHYGNSLIKPTLKMRNNNNNKNVINNNNINNHKLEEISYTNKNKKYKYNFVKPKPSILPVCRTTKNINNEKNEKKQTNIEYNIHINKKDNNKISSYHNSSSIHKNKNILNNNNNNTNANDCENKKGRNVRIIRTQKHGPSIIEKKFIAHSCEKCNNLNFKKNNYSIRDNFHVILSIKNYDQPSS